MVLPENQLGNNILIFTFVILSMISGYIVSLWYYAMTRRRDDRGRMD